MAVSLHPLPSPLCPNLDAVVWVLQATSNNTESAVNQQPAASTSSQDSVSDGGEASSSQQQESSSAGFLQQEPSILRRVISSSTAADAYELLQQHQQQHMVVSTADVDLLLRCSLEAGNVALALSIYQQLRAAQRAQAAGGPAAPSSTWPAATLQHTETLMKGLCRQLRVNDALAVLRSIRSHGVPGSEEVRGLLLSGTLIWSIKLTLSCRAWPACFGMRRSVLAPAAGCYLSWVH